MPIKNLISFPKLPLFVPQMVDAFTGGELVGETLFKYGKVAEVSSTISVRLLMDGEDPTFVVGEALQSLEDEFSKEVGKRIADGRAIARNVYHEDSNWSTFTLSEAKEQTDDMYGRTEKGKVVTVSSVKLPISGLPLPHGIVNRLKMLVPRT